MEQSELNTYAQTIDVTPDDALSEVPQASDLQETPPASYSPDGDVNDTQDLSDIQDSTNINSNVSSQVNYDSAYGNSGGFGDLNYNGFLNFFILVLVFLAAKFVFTRFLMAAKKGHEEKNNLAYTISVFSLFVSLSLILTSVIYGDLSLTLQESATKLLTYAGLGILLLIATGFIFDKIAFNKVHINKEIGNGNVAAALADAGNFIASGLIIAAALKWQEFKNAEGIISVLSIYVASQIILTGATLLRVARFNRQKDIATFQQQIARNNIAAAVDFAGRRIATAFAITASTSLLSFQSGLSLVNVIGNWILMSLVMVIGLNILSWIASNIIFWNRNLHKQIVDNNINAALCDAAIYVSFGIILYGTMV